VDELRRSYHDRIAEVRAQTVDLVQIAARATRQLTSELAEGADETGGQIADDQIADDLSAAARMVAGVEADVLDLLALQAPVARDLRVILAARDIARTGELCLGLCRTLSERAKGAQDVLSADLRIVIGEMGSETANVLLQANAAWTALDEQQAQAVMGNIEVCRQLQRTFLADLLELRSVPVNAAVDLGMIARAYERLADHAVEIASSVMFVVTGELPSAGVRKLKL